MYLSTYKYEHNIFKNLKIGSILLKNNTLVDTSTFSRNVFIWPSNCDYNS